MLSALELLSLQLTHGLLEEISQYWPFTAISHLKEKKMRAMERRTELHKLTEAKLDLILNCDINDAPMHWGTISIG